MTTSRATMRDAVSDALGPRHLVWTGIRGDDAESLGDLPQFAASFTIINTYAKRPLRHSVSYEELTGSRMDMETWDIDDHQEEQATKDFRGALLREMAHPCALLPYRPSRFLSALWFARKDRCINLGLFGSHQYAFEHKPWVESALADLGIPHLDWRYIADEEQLDARRLLADGPVMLRRSRTSGGEGLFRVDDPDALIAAWPRQAEAFVSVSPFVEGAVPINVGATVWADGVTVHFPSVQMIGVPSCVTRPFGYCGNDFAAAKRLHREILDEIEATTVRIGSWLRTYGYLGTFGVDYLLHRGRLLFTEINPRFQGSSRASAQLSVALDQPCILLEHIAAMLGLRRAERLPLAEAVAQAPDLAQIVVHNTGTEPTSVPVDDLRRRLRGADKSCRTDVALSNDVAAEPGAVLGRFTFGSSVTEDGFNLRADLEDAIRLFRDRPTQSRSEA